MKRIIIPLLISVVSLFSCQTITPEFSDAISPVQATWEYGRFYFPAKYTHSNQHILINQKPDQLSWVKHAEKDISKRLL